MSILPIESGEKLKQLLPNVAKPNSITSESINDLKSQAELIRACIAGVDPSLAGFRRLMLSEPNLLEKIGEGAFGASAEPLENFAEMVAFFDLNEGQDLRYLHWSSSEAEEFYCLWRDVVTEESAADFFKHLFSYVKLIIGSSESDEYTLHKIEEFISETLVKQAIRFPSTRNTTIAGLLEQIAEYLEAPQEKTFTSNKVDTSQEILKRQKFEKEIRGLLPFIDGEYFFNTTYNLERILRRAEPEIATDYPSPGRDPRTLAIFGDYINTDPTKYTEEREIRMAFQREFMSLLENLISSSFTKFAVVKTRQSVKAFVFEMLAKYPENAQCKLCGDYLSSSLDILTRLLEDNITGVILADKVVFQPNTDYKEFFWKSLPLLRDIVADKPVEKYHHVVVNPLQTPISSEAEVYEELSKLMVTMIRDSLTGSNFTGYNLPADMANHPLYKELSFAKKGSEIKVIMVEARIASATEA